MKRYFGFSELFYFSMAFFISGWISLSYAIRINKPWLAWGVLLIAGIGLFVDGNNEHRGVYDNN